MPAAAQAAEPPGLSEGRQVFAEPGGRLVGRESTVRESCRQARLLDERIGQPGGIGSQYEDRADGTDRDEPEAQAGPGGEGVRGDAEWSDLRDRRRRLIAIRGGEHSIE